MIKILTDSSVAIDPEITKELDITIVPLSVMLNGKLYSDADLKEVGKFRKLMQESSELPKTSQPSVGLFAETYENLVAAGADQIIAIHLTHGLSGTIEASRQGADIAGAPVTVVDSSFTDQALKFQVVEAAKLAKAGVDLATILERIEEVRAKSELFIGVSTLENLVKGGRIGRVSGLLGSFLNIKVIMEQKNHELIPVAKGRGTKTFTKWLETWKANVGSRQIAEIGISYSGTSDFALSLKEDLSKLVDESKICVLETGSTIQTHTGDGAFAIMVRYE